MSKRLKRLLFAAVAVVALVALLVVLLLLPKAEEPQEEEPDERILLYEFDDEKLSVQTVDIVTPSETFRIVRNEDDQLCVEAYRDLPINTSKLASLEDYFFKLSANKKVLDNTDDPAQFGLAEPAVQMTITYSDDSSLSFALGDMAPGNDGYYFRMGGDDAVYLLGSYSGGLFLTPSKNYVGTAMILTPMANDDDGNAYLFLNEATITGTARTEPLILHSVDDSLADEFPYCNYYIEKPHRAGVTTDSDIETGIGTLTALSALSVDTVHPSADRIRECGLDQPAVQADIDACIRTYTIDDDDNKVFSSYSHEHYLVKLGNKSPDGYYYGMVDGVDVIYNVTVDSVPWATYTYNDIATNMLFLRNIATISELTFTAAGKTTTFTIGHSENADTGNDEITVKANGKAMSDTDSFRKVYQVLMNVPRVGDADKPTGTAAVRLVMKNLAGETVEDISFYKRSASTYTCALASDDQYAVSASAVENIVTQVNNYLEGKAVKIG